MRVILATISFLTLVAGCLVTLPVTAQEKEYKTTAPRTVLLKGELAAFKGKEVNVISLDLPPGWVGGRHYHTGDVFVYVQEGSFAVDIDGEGRKTFHAGQVYQALKKVMHARNPSSTKPAKIILFQVGDKGEPLMIKAK